MNKPILSLLFSLAITLGSTLNGQTSFFNLYGSVNGEAGERVVPLSTGGYLMAGSTDDAMFGWKDIFVTKVDAAGNLVWSKKLGTADYEHMVEIVENPQGGCYVALSRHDPYWVTPYGSTVVVALDANGNTTMVKKFTESARHVTPCDLIATSNGGFMILAQTNDYSTQNSARLKVISCASNGNIIWSKTYSQPGMSSDISGQFVPGNGGDIIIAGTSLSASLQYSLLVFSINSSGNPMWSSEFPLANQTWDKVADMTVQGNNFLITTTKGDLHYFTQSGTLIWSRNVTYVGMFDNHQVDYSNGKFCFVGTVVDVMNYYTGIIFEIDTFGNMLSSGKIYENTHTWITDVHYISGGDVVLTGWVYGGFNAQDSASVLLMRGGVSLGNLCGYSFLPVQMTSQTLASSAITMTMTTAGSVANMTFSSSSGTLVLTSCLVSVDEQQMNSEVKLYPNPANEFFVIESSGMRSGQCYLYNAIGELVLVEQLTTERTEVTCSDILPGMYFYSVISDGEVIDRGKIIME